MIRNGTMADIPAIIAIGQSVITASRTYDGEVDTAKASRTLRRAFNDARMAVFVAEVGGNVVGFFIAMQDDLWFADATYATDIAFCVAAGHENQGVWLLRRFMRWCKSRNIKDIKLGLSTGMDPEGRTGRLYEAHGLVNVGGIYASLHKEAKI